MSKHKHAITARPPRPEKGRKSSADETVPPGMTRSRKCLLFCAWFVILGALWLFACAPIDTYRRGDRPAGFPLRFAVWNAGELVEFQGWNLGFDIGIGLVTLLGISWVCVNSAASKRPTSHIPRVHVLLGVVFVALMLFFSQLFFGLVDYNVGYFGRLAGLYPELDKPAKIAPDRFPLKK